MQARERIEKVVREWNQWSPAERRVLDEIVEQVMRWAISGEGSTFIKQWCERVLRPALRENKGSRTIQFGGTDGRKYGLYISLWQELGGSLWVYIQLYKRGDICMLFHKDITDPVAVELARECVDSYAPRYSVLCDYLMDHHGFPTL